MEKQRRNILTLASRPGGVSASELLDKEISLLVAAELFDSGALSIDLPMSKNIKFRTIKSATVRVSF